MIEMARRGSSMAKISPIITIELYNRFVSVLQSRHQTKPLLYDELFDLFQQVSGGLDPAAAQDELNKLSTGCFKQRIDNNISFLTKLSC